MNSKKNFPLESIKSLLVINLGLTLVFFMTERIEWLILGFSCGMIGLSSSRLRAIIHKSWSALGDLLGFIFPRIPLSLLFYLFLTPMALLSRFFRKDILLLHNKSDSMFKAVDKRFTKESFEKPW